MIEIYDHLNRHQFKVSLSNWHCQHSRLKSNLEKDLIVTVDNAVDGLKYFVVGLGVDVDAMAVRRMVRRGHEDLEDADVVMQQVGKCKRKGNLKMKNYYYGTSKRLERKKNNVLKPNKSFSFLTLIVFYIFFYL